MNRTLIFERLYVYELHLLYTTYITSTALLKCYFPKALIQPVQTTVVPLYSWSNFEGYTIYGQTILYLKK